MSAQDAISIFNAGIDAVKPAMLIPQYLRLSNETFYAGNIPVDMEMLDAGDATFALDDTDTYVLCIGKAAAAMALEVEKILGNKIKAGLVITKSGHALPLQYYKTIEADHPVPGGNSMAAAKAVADFLKPLKPPCLLLCCISGGASALLADMAEGITLQDMQQLSALLLHSGADIYEINTVRKHLAFLKGGQLIKLSNSILVSSLIISDVLGDDISVIASGLTVADASTFAGARDVLDKYGLSNKIPASITKRLASGGAGLIAETPKPGDAIFKRVTNTIIGSNNTALKAAAMYAAHLGYDVHIMNDQLQGEAGAEAKKFVQLLLQHKGPRPACLLMGGETTVTIKGNGKGGRNQQFALAALYELQQQNITPENMPVILSGGTDGTDGPTDAAGAYIDMNIFLTMQNLYLDAYKYLQNNDAYHFFKQTGGLILTGPTQTNVMDIIVGLIK